MTRHIEIGCSVLPEFVHFHSFSSFSDLSANVTGNSQGGNVSGLDVILGVTTVPTLVVAVKAKPHSSFGIFGHFGRNENVKVCKSFKDLLAKKSIFCGALSGAFEELYEWGKLYRSKGIERRQYGYAWLQYDTSSAALHSFENRNRCS